MKYDIVNNIVIDCLFYAAFNANPVLGNALIFVRPEPISGESWIK